MAFSYCPECASRIYLGGRPWVGQPVICDYCDADLEVLVLNPPELGWVDELTEEVGLEIPVLEMDTT